jgi:hypothetical protein
MRQKGGLYMPQMGFELGLPMEESRNGPVELAADFVKV